MGDLQEDKGYQDFDDEVFVQCISYNQIQHIFPL
jgi:hypothetical protein